MNLINCLLSNITDITVKHLNVAQYQTSRIHDTFTNVFSGLVKVKSLWNNLFIVCQYLPKTMKGLSKT